MEKLPEIKLCKNCEFCKKGYDFEYLHSKCTNVNANIDARGTVTDEHMFVNGCGTFASILRADERFCGISAKYFKQKESFFSKIFK
jgi:hypothetical protein